MTGEVEEIIQRLADHDAYVAALPCAPGRAIPAICPYCKATERDACGPRSSAEHTLIADIRVIVTEPPQ